MNDLKEHLADCVPSKQFVLQNHCFLIECFLQGLWLGL